MGLLSNATARKRLITIILCQGNRLSVISFISGVVWFLLLAYQPFNAATYFSENALLPGLVDSSFYHDYGGKQFLKELRSELKRIKELSIKNEDEYLRYQIPSEWLEKQFLSIGLDVYRQNFSFFYPVNLMKSRWFTGNNFYAVLRAPHISSTESVVLSLPYRPPGSNLDKTLPGIALMYAVAKAFRKQTYWSKDIIFLITEHENVGMQAWLESYHSSPSKYIVGDELSGRCGSIQAAINLEITHEKISKINLKLEGLNGQMPNLDLVNTVVRLCRKEGVAPSLHKTSDYWNPESVEGYKLSLSTLLKMMWTQAPGSPSGLHGLYHKYHIEALTVQSVRTTGSSKIGLVEMGRILEGIFRSLNNLMERFHQSFFFYLLSATERYISIGLYMPPFGLMLIPLLIKIIILWINISSNDKTDRENSLDKSKDDSKSKSENKDNSSQIKDDGYLSLMPVCFLAFFFGLATYFGSAFFVETGAAMHMKPEEALAWGNIALFISSLLFPTMLMRKARQIAAKKLKEDENTRDKDVSTKEPKNPDDSLASDQADSITEQEFRFGPDPTLLRFVSILMFTLLMSVTCLMNISLAFFITLLWVPLLIFIQPTKSRFLTCLQLLCCLIICPFTVLYWGNLIDTILRKNFTSLIDLTSEAWSTTQVSLLHAVVDHHMMSNWTFSFFTLLLMPNWLLIWTLPWCASTK